MINRMLVLLTNYSCWLLKKVKLDKNFRKNNDVRFVFYHGIGDKTSASMKYLNDETPKTAFQSHIEHLEKRYTLVSLKDAVDLIGAKKIPYDKPLCTISFDDGLQSVYKDAYPVLKEQDIPFDVFLNTSVIDNNGMLWLHAMNYLLTTYGAVDVADTINEKIGEDLSKAPPNALGIEHWCRMNFDYFNEKRIVERLFANYNLSLKEVAAEENLYLTWDQVEEMSGNNVGFYSHTHSHFPLDAILNTEIIKSEITTAREIIKAHGQKTDFVSFPFGMEVDYGRRAVKEALEAGHQYVVEVGGGLNSPDKMMNRKLISRVGLGNIEPACEKLHASIEVRPIIKGRLKSLLAGQQSPL